MSDTAERKSGTACDQDSSKAKSKLPSDSTMYQGVANGVAISVLRTVKPVYSKVVYKVPADKSTKKLLKDIRKNKNVGPAIDELAEIFEVDSYNSSAAIAMGVAYEMFGDAEQAVATFEKAVALEPKAEKHLERATIRKREVSALASIGLDVKAGLPEAGAGRIVNVKGSSSKRTPLTEEPGGGATVANVPGKLKLTVIATSGKYLLVRAPDGKEGYISASMVK
jgi:tetratricopeptide (TPR) repeat protein